ncbi:hypothetical protein EYF80_022847 [Liparis tanakae]|uniref:Uncharacterized protein n=1 Tax=Liparis tanakae TaxID=230148 RepID=A0A4Z2HMX6_9TELE|nr:hypothetical protein EYF80_022847 [Liparis tanakae]
MESSREGASLRGRATAAASGVCGVAHSGAAPGARGRGPSTPPRGPALVSPSHTLMEQGCI